MKQQTEKKPTKGFWVLYTWSECALCGRPDNTRERMYTPKPKDPAERHKQGELFACDCHFM